MKNFLTTLSLLIILLGFSAFIVINGKSKNVLSVITPTKIGIDFNDDKSIDSSEIICIENIEAFSLEISDEFYNKYSKILNLNRNDMIALGYLAEEYAQKTLEEQKVSFKFSDKVTSECKYASIKINGTDYKLMLQESGFGITGNHIGNTEKFKKNLNNAKKLHLVILNHHSGKFHTLDCPYGNVANDKIIIPQNQLPADTKPCKFCHKKQAKTHKKYKYKKDNNIYAIPNIIQPSLVSSNGNIKIIYTDFTKKLIPDNKCDSTVCKEFIHRINSAQNSIDMAIYGYSEVPAVTSALKNAKLRGVKIRFVYDESSNPEKNYYKDNYIIRNIADFYRSDKSQSSTSSNMLMHNKFVIIDNKAVITGSMNISPSGLSGYDVNDVIIINSKEVAALYRKEFEQMLNGKFHTKKEKLNLPNHFIMGNSELEIYFSPEDKSSTKIIQLIKGAKKYIYVPAFLITHSNIANELILAKKRGIDVRIIIDANSTATKNSKHAILRNNGILLKTENYAGKLHSKTMIIDDEYLITGSMNFSNSGENKNDENLLIIKNSEIAKHHKNFFLYLWTMIPDKYLKINAKPESKDSIGSCTDGVDNNFNGKIDKEEELCKAVF